MAEQCDCCGNGYDTVYRVPDAIWEIAADVSDGSGLLCPECCDWRARQEGIELFWEAMESEYPTTALYHENAHLRKLLRYVWAQTPGAAVKGNDGHMIRCYLRIEKVRAIADLFVEEDDA